MKFNKTDQIILKVYLFDCKVLRDKQRFVIVITHDEYLFSSNDGPCFGRQKDGNIFFPPKSKARRIMLSEFPLFFCQLNLSFLLKPS